MYYSSNDLATAKKGNTGIFSYVSKGANYDIYIIVDFDEGYVFWFNEGNGEDYCDRVEIVTGDLNSVMIITYHDGDEEWSYGLHFKWKKQPDHLVVQDEDGFEWDYYNTSLEKALELKNSKTIIDY